jgi:hypothetical protein
LLNLLRYKSSLMVFLLPGSLCFAQPFARQVESIPVTIAGSAVTQPFAGGVNAPRHEFVDIDADGDPDLFILDSDDHLDFYRNEGTAFLPNFKLCRNCVSLPGFLFWFLFVDLNGDGNLDLCTDDSSNGVRLFRNDGTAQSPDFVLESATLFDSAGNPLNAGFSSIPAFVDIDGDTLTDFLSSNSLDGSVNFYRNIGTRSSPSFKFVSGSFQGITVLGDSCYSAGLRKITPHGAGNLRYADVDGNGTNDMFYGDLFSHGVFFMNNVGTPTQPLLECTTNRYPDPSLVTDGYNQPSFVDVDGDGDLDMFVGVLNNLEGHGFWYYRNEGTSSIPKYQLVTTDYLSTIDVGASAHPAFADITAGGVTDMFLGTLDGALWHFKNTGTPEVPSFELLDTMFAGISGNFTYAPAFVDIDGDGDEDLFIGRFDGRIKFYQNTGTASSPLFVAAASPVDTINVNQNAVPAFIDYEGDGDEDLFVGKANGRISFYRNEGNPADFRPVLVQHDFLAVDIGANSKPAFCDIDNDGDPDLFIGCSEGTITYYQFTGPRSTPAFIFRDDHFAAVDPLRESAPAFVDLDHDGDPDLFVGTSKGGIHFYRNNFTSGVDEVQGERARIELFQNYPNPFSAGGGSASGGNPEIDFGFRIVDFGLVVMKIFDIEGREVATLVNEVKQPGVFTISWKADNLSTGVYFARLTSGASTIVRKLILAK